MSKTNGLIWLLAVCQTGAILGCGASGASSARAHGPEPSTAPLRARQASRDQNAEPHARPGASSRLFAAETLDRRGLVRAVLERNPSMEAAEGAWQAARARKDQQSSLPDPMLAYSFAPLSIGSSHARYGQVIELSQRFPWPGKLAERGEMAIAAAEAKHADVEITRLNLALLAATMFDDWYAVERALEVNRDFSVVFGELKGSAEAQYAAGRGSLQDPLQVEVELAHLDHQRVVLLAERASIVARLNALLHRAPDAPLPPPAERAAETTPKPPARPVLEELAFAHRPELSGERARIKESQAALELADKEYFPDLTVMASYNSMWPGIEHQIMVGVAANVPLQRATRQGAYDEAGARLSASRHRLSRVADDIRAEVEQARLKLIEAQHVAHLYRTRLLPATRDQVDAALAGFQTGRNSFFEVMNAQKNLLTTELGRHMAVAEMHRRVAALDRALGRPAGLEARGSAP